MGNEKKFDLQDRLIDFAVKVIKVTEALPNNGTGNHIRGQLLRCGTSTAANYGEAQSAESRSDFIHKIKIVLKELRETKVWMILIQRAGLIKTEERIKTMIQENDELISIFVKSEQTARRNRKNE